MVDFSLKGKTALVTGASRGLGWAIAKGFAQAGADIVLIARSNDALEKNAREIRTLGRKADVFPFNLQKVDEIPELFEKIVAAVGAIDILLNVAGTTFRSEAEKFPRSEWDRVISANLTSPFILSQCFARERIRLQKPGKIINIASLLSEAARPTIPAYTASKGGIKQVTKALAVEWAKYGINVNAIGPGYFATEMTKPLQENPEFDRWVKERTPMKRWGQPEELVGAAVFLASSASDFITGQVIYVDGGWLASL